VELNRWYDIKIAVSGGRIKCYLNGVLIHDLMEAGGTARGTAGIMASCVKDTKTGDVIVKLVNVTAETAPSQIQLSGIGQLQPTARRTILTGDPRAKDTFQNPTNVIPVTDKVNVGKSFTTDLPAHSLTVMRIKTR